MFVAKLLRRLGYLAMAVVCLSVVAIVFALRTPFLPLPEEGERISPGEVESDGLTDSEGSARDEAPKTPANNPQLAIKRRPAQNAVPAAIKLPTADPFLSLSEESNSPGKESTPAKEAISRKADRKTAPAAFDPRETSWENPFVAGYWEGAGWNFNPDGMSSQGPRANATFRRSYRRLMLEARIEPLQEPSTPLQLRLLAPATGSAVVIAIQAGDLTVTGNSRAPNRLQEKVILNPASTPGTTAMLRVAGTGNRLMFHWNNQVVLTCDQPAAQSGRDLLLDWSTGVTPYRITSLRLEGE